MTDGSDRHRLMDPRKERTINALLQAAEALFRDRAVDEVTVEELAERAGVAVGSLYNHFGSKAGLHAAVVERALEVNRTFMDRAYLEHGTPAEQIGAAAEEYLAFYLAQPEYFRMLAFPAAPGQYPAGHEVADRLAHRVDEQNQRLVRALQAGIDAGSVRALDAEEAATALWAAWNGIISLAWRHDSLRRDEAELRHLLEVATDIVAHGLLTGP